MEFKGFGKIPRLSREIVVTEKIDGTNALIHITESGELLTGSRTRWITPSDDNYGFSKWANEKKDLLMTLGPGSHFGEWWGQGIQRKYGLNEKRFSLFNSSLPPEKIPACCSIVPVLYMGQFETEKINDVLNGLEEFGSAAAPGFLNPEGIIIYHIAAGQYFKKTIEKDDEMKGTK